MVIFLMFPASELSIYKETLPNKVAQVALLMLLHISPLAILNTIYPGFVQVSSKAGNIEKSPLWT